jgi:hypothetical protein
VNFHSPASNYFAFSRLSQDNPSSDEVIEFEIHTDFFDLQNLLKRSGPSRAYGKKQIFAHRISSCHALLTRLLGDSSTFYPRGASDSMGAVSTSRR